MAGDNTGSQIDSNGGNNANVSSNNESNNTANTQNTGNGENNGGQTMSAADLISQAAANNTGFGAGNDGAQATSTQTSNDGSAASGEAPMNTTNSNDSGQAGQAQSQVGQVANQNNQAQDQQQGQQHFWTQTNKEELQMYERILTMDHAQGVALEQVPGNVERVKMDLVYGVMFYKFYITTEENKRFLVEVDAKAGKVLRLKELKPDSD
jgi:uncharacterized membrane protein YkoI